MTKKTKTKMITVDTEAHEGLLWAKKQLRKTGVRDPTHSDAIRYLISKRQDQLEGDLEDSVEGRSCTLCFYKVDASEDEDKAAELMADHFESDHGYEG